MQSTRNYLLNILIFTYIWIINTQDLGEKYSFRYVNVDSCQRTGTNREFYDVSSLSCKACQQNSTAQVTSGNGEVMF